jgi:hypothetical protein
MPSYMVSRSSTARSILRLLCLTTAIGNAGGNILLLCFYRPIFALLGVPLPRDLFSFVAVSGFSFTMGLLAYLVYRAPDKSTGLLVVGIAGKGLYALTTFYFFYEQKIHWFYLVFGAWDAAFAVVFSLFFIHIAAPDLDALDAGMILPGGGRERTKRALLLYYSLTGNGKRAMSCVEEGLTRKGYAVDAKAVQPVEPLFRFPFSFSEFARIMLRAILRVPAPIEPIGLPADHPYDLIVVENQTWFVGMAAPMESLFLDPANRAIFRGRDVATVNVCRGLWRRSQAMLVRWAQRSGGHVVGGRACSNPGWEPARTFSLFLFLAYGEEGRPRFLRGWFLQRQYLAEEKLAALVRFGEALAERPGPGEPPRDTGDVSG